MKLSRISAGALILSLAAFTTQAATVITFEEGAGGLVAMTNAPGTLVPTSGQLANQYLASDGVSFASLGGFAALVNHGAGNPTASNPNIIGGTTADGRLSYNAAITISFFDVANASTKAVTDSFRIQGDWVPLGSGQVFATAYDAIGNALGSTSDTDNKVFGVSGPVLQFGIAGIHSVVISSNNGTVGFDQLEYGTLTPVPEPEAWALLAAGLVVVAVMARRRTGVVAGRTALR